MRTETDYALHIFVDESGQHDLDTKKRGASNLYVCVAVVLTQPQVSEADAAMKAISLAHFGGTEVKSVKVGAKHRRRIRILQDISKIAFAYYALVIDKASLERDSGFQYKDSYYKAIHDMLFDRVCRPGVQTRVTVDRYGGGEFAASFREYLATKDYPPLFTHVYPPEFKDSEDEPLIQLADFVAGTLSYCLDEDKRSEHVEDFRACIADKQIGIKGWPLRRVQSLSPPLAAEAGIDAIIRASSTGSADDFVRRFEDDKKDLDRRMQAAALAHLLFLVEYDPDPGHHTVHAKALIDHLKRLGFPDLVDAQLRSRVIGPLRDAGMLISSNPVGYRIATSSADLNEHVQYMQSMVEPMIGRLCRAREAVSIATANKHDILALAEFASLKAIVDAFADQAVGWEGEADPT